MKTGNTCVSNGDYFEKNREKKKLEYVVKVCWKINNGRFLTSQSSRWHEDKVVFPPYELLIYLADSEAPCLISFFLNSERIHKRVYIVNITQFSSSQVPGGCDLVSQRIYSLSFPSSRKRIPSFVSYFLFIIHSTPTRTTRLKRILPKPPCRTCFLTTCIILCRLLLPPPPPSFPRQVLFFSAHVQVEESRSVKAHACKAKGEEAFLQKRGRGSERRSLLATCKNIPYCRGTKSEEIRWNRRSFWFMDS